MKIYLFFVAIVFFSSSVWSEEKEKVFFLSQVGLYGVTKVVDAEGIELEGNGGGLTTSFHIGSFQSPGLALHAGLSTYMGNHGELFVEGKKTGTFTHGASFLSFGFSILSENIIFSPRFLFYTGPDEIEDKKNYNSDGTRYSYKTKYDYNPGFEFFFGHELTKKKGGFSMGWGMSFLHISYEARTHYSDIGLVNSHGDEGIFSLFAFARFSSLGE